jgi:hypothetical protein
MGFLNEVESSEPLPYVDDHSIFTSSMIATLSNNKNLLISEKRYKKALNRILYSDRRKRLFDADGYLKQSDEVFMETVELFAEYVKKLVGFAVRIRDAGDEPGCEHCVVMEYSEVKK